MNVMPTLSTGGLLRSLKFAIGMGLSQLHSRRTRQLYRAPQSSPSGWVDRALLSFLKQRCQREGREKFFARLHQSFWSGGGGAIYAENCDYRFQEVFLKRHTDAVEKLEAIWAEHPEINRLVEIGTGSGLLLEYLQQRHPDLRSYVGLDINAAQIQRNCQKYAQSKLEFFACDAKQWLIDHGQSGTAFITNCGVLEYFTANDLRDLLTHISQQLPPALFLAIEPVAHDHDLQTMLDSKTFGDELSFSHNYPHLFQECGFQVVELRESFFEQYRTVVLVAAAGR